MKQLAKLIFLLACVGGCWGEVEDTCAPGELENCFPDEACVDDTCQEQPSSCGDGEVARGIECARVKELTAGAAHFCALFTDGELWCWGSGNDQFQLTDSFDGDEVTADCLRRSVDHVAAGWSHTCVVQEGVPWCWGANRLGQADPDNAGVTDQAPVRKPSELGISDVTSVSGGFEHTCVIAADQASCWGGNSAGEVTGSATSAHVGITPAPVDDVTSISTGEHTTCAVTGGRLDCWGEIDLRQALIDHEVPGGRAPKHVVAGVSIACAWNDAGTVCVEAPAAQMTLQRTVVDTSGGIDSIHAGWRARRICGLSDGNLQCGTASDLGPVLHTDVSLVAVGLDRRCMVHDGRVRCWTEGSEPEVVRFITECEL